MPKTTIYVACHKESPLIQNDQLVPIHVGRALGNHIPGIEITDNTGDNISDKNPRFCELTALYWIWKNDHTSQFVGLNHYRRYFDTRNRELGRFVARNFKHQDPNVATFDEVQSRIANFDYTRYLEHNDVIIARPMHLKLSVKEQYIKDHNALDFEIMRQCVADIDAAYLPAFDEFVAGKKMSIFNMFVMRKRQFDHYCEWLFGVMNLLEQRVAISDDPYQARVFGFMAERLLNVYVKHNKLKTRRLPVLLVK